MPHRRRLLGAAALGLLAPPARAEAWPTRPIRALVGYVAGGGVDITLRVMAPRMAAVLGQPVLVDNRPGGAGSLANEIGLRAPPDGYTVLVATIGQTTVNPALAKAPGLDPVAECAPISLLVQVTNLLVVPADRPWRSVAELVAAARAQPDALAYGSSSVGSAGHLSAAVLDQAAGTRTLHVPYRGGGQLITDLVSGKLDFAFATAATTLPHVEAGRLRALAVPTAQRSRLLPDLPTVAESGVPGYAVNNWYAVSVPKDTPPAIIGQLNAAFRAALADPEAVRRLAQQALEPLPSSPAEFAAFHRAEITTLTELARAAHIDPN